VLILFANVAKPVKICSKSETKSSNAPSFWTNLVSQRDNYFQRHSDACQINVKN